jgi:hypothetical protein
MRCLAVMILVLLLPTRSSADEAAELWHLIRQGLTGPDSANFWQHTLKDALLPGGSMGARALRGEVLAWLPAERPTRLVLAMSDEKTPEVTLKVAPPLKSPFPKGTVVLFAGVAAEFSKDPFMLTFDVEQDGSTFVEKESK